MKEYKKDIKAQRVKPLTPTWAINTLTGDEEHIKKKKEQKERSIEEVSIPTNLDHVVASYELQRSYGEPNLLSF